MPAAQPGRRNRKPDPVGTRYGRLVVEGAAAPIGGRRAHACRCDCGAAKAVQEKQLRNGHTQSCGCLEVENRERLQRRLAAEARVHGHGSVAAGRSRTYRSWESMKRRCLAPTSPDYARYGGAGVTVCERWRESFAAFLQDMGERPEGMSLDRVDPWGDYMPENCRWATAKVQRANRRSADPAPV